ncbi:hypothetical protein BT63DRAFT_126199 [Microthyrium microscopicum]|uniref:SnoaL-like domain-containing protein n=1 Tax=Microthyrium microscopicum TaxID=703497 RepID=A0A6A6TXK5_9PEZI|nr:hypothetical protein BT63DRAFT_126199 [Microthyrium microscopicum]
MSPQKQLHIQQKHHVDHDTIMKRLDAYITAYRSGKPEAMMEFFHPENVVYSDFAAGLHGLSRSEIKETYKRTFSEIHDVNIKTLSVHGHKDFTAWEWEVFCKPEIDTTTGEKVGKENSSQKHLAGCTLMWWQDGKIIRNHDYMQMKDA